MDMDRFRQILTEECGLDPETLLVAGISGGPDSLCLLDMLCRVGVPVVAAHFDHGLRPESAREACMVEAEAKRRGVKYILGRENVRETALVEGLSIEEAARQARYRFLFSQARSLEAGAVAVAHHADDQVETVLMHLLRGSGLSGLKGMTSRVILPVWDAEIPLVRPLLNMWRAEVLSYCAEHGLDPVYDESNSDPQYFRNRLRHELIPVLESYNPRFKEGVLRMSNILAGDYEALQEAVQAAWKDCVVRKEEGYLVLDLKMLRDFSSGLRKNIIRAGIAHLRPALRDIDYEMVKRAESFALQPPASKQTQLAGQIWLEVEGEVLIIARDLAEVRHPEWPGTDPQSELLLMVPSRIPLEGGWLLVIESGTAEELDRGRLARSGADEAWLDADKLELPLKLRTYKSGDRFQPFGMGGHSMKLSDFWINERLPRRARERWPLVCSGEKIAWVCGSRLADPFRVTGSTRQIVHLRLERAG